MYTFTLTKLTYFNSNLMELNLIDKLDSKSYERSDVRNLLAHFLPNYYNKYFNKYFKKLTTLITNKRKLNNLLN